MEDTGEYEHTQSIKNLENDKKYIIYIKCSDGQTESSGSVGFKVNK